LDELGFSLILLNVRGIRLKLIKFACVWKAIYT